MTERTTNLWCQVLGSSAERAGLVAEANLLLAEPKVSYFNVPVFVQQQILQLKTCIRPV